MLKLLCIETGHVFTLPDEEALKIKAQDWANYYKIIDAGLQKEETEKLSQETIESLIIKDEKLDDQDIEINDAIAKQIKPNKIDKKITEDTLNLEKMTVPELIGIAQRLNLKVNKRHTKPYIIQKIRETGTIQ